MSFRKNFASIIIVVKNDRDIDRTLGHLDRMRNETPCEVIVVDASEPERLADIKEKYEWVRWDQFPVSNKRTTPAQRNRGLELAKGDMILFIDANCVPTTGWLTAIISTLKSGKDIVCGPVHDLNENNLVHYANDLKKGKYVDECTTINVGLRRTVVEKIGNFDTKFPFGQDVDFFWRAGEAGYKIYYNPAVAIGHDWGESKEQLKRAYNYGRARARLFKKHWRTRHGQLLHESHVWAYPLFIIGLPVTYFIPVYPLLLFVPLLKNRSRNSLGLVLHHLTFGVGVIVGTLRP